MKNIILFILLLSLQLVAQTKQTQLDITVSVISQMSETVHSLQQERGASCGYISSHSEKFSEKLTQITQNSDKKVSTLHQLLNNNTAVLEKYFTKQEHAILDETFLKLYDIREEVREFRIDFAKTYSIYTQSISFLLMNISKISDKIQNKELSDELYIYSTLLMYKESIGQKRAALSALFSKEKFQKEIFEYYLT